MMLERETDSQKRWIKDVRRKNRMPVQIMVAEAFLVVMVALYILKIGLLASVIFEGMDVSQNMLMSVLYTILMLTAMSAIMGLSSRRASSWRKVMRNCLTFTLMSFVSAFVYSSDSITHVVDTNPFLTLIVLALVMAMMLYSDSVKRFYTPSMMEVKPVRDWAKYIFVGSLYSDEYRVVRGS